MNFFSIPMDSSAHGASRKDGDVRLLDRRGRRGRVHEVVEEDMLTVPHLDLAGPEEEDLVGDFPWATPPRPAAERRSHGHAHNNPPPTTRPLFRTA